MEMEKLSKKSTVGKEVKILFVKPLIEKSHRTVLHSVRGRVSTRNIKCSRLSVFNKVKCPKFKHIKEYCENSSIHGVRYFTNKNIHGFERLCWILSVILSMIGCYILIRNSNEKWSERPVIVSFSEKMTSIKTIPFPAVTICPEIKSRKEIFDFTKTLNRFNLSQLPHYGLTEDEYSLQCMTVLEKMMAPDKAEMLVECRFRTKLLDCEYSFQNIITEDGICFTFNSFFRGDMFHNGTNFEMSSDLYSGYTGRWTMENGYAYEMEDDVSILYPHRVLSGGASVGLTVLLGVQELDLDYQCRGATQGFKVILHSPNELPDVDGQHVRLSFDNDVRMSIKPNVMVTAKSLANYTPNRRQCYFNSERRLRFMKEYTQRNCLLECLANFTLQHCGCVQFYMPRNDDTPICGERNILCGMHLANSLWTAEGTTDDGTISACDCLPACTSIVYDAEMSQAKYEFHEYQSALRVSDFPEGFKMARLSVFFKESQFISSKRSELMGMTDFVAVCGGLLGLFMGISLLSIVELVYYFSMRVVFGSRPNNTKAEGGALVRLILPSARDISFLLEDKQISPQMRNNY